MEGKPQESYCTHTQPTERWTENLLPTTLAQLAYRRVCYGLQTIGQSFELWSAKHSTNQINTILERYM